MPKSHPEILHNDESGIARASDILRHGGLLALPTETVYGLAADARNAYAVARIFKAKGRPVFNPLIVHVPDLDAARELVDVSKTAELLAKRFWPGPLTLVLPSKGTVADLVSSGLQTLAVRVPSHPTAKAVLNTFGGPVAAPSANPSGQVSPTTAKHVAEGLGARVDAILDAGACRVGLESTILAVDANGSVRLLREGGVAREALEAFGIAAKADLTPDRAEAPGQMERHYATNVPLVLGGEVGRNDITIGFGDRSGDLTLSPSGDLVEAATRLYAVLHEADALAAAYHAPAIRIATLPETGLGRAINDRLRRAAAK